MIPSALKAQLYLIAGTPRTNEFAETYAADLFQVNGGGLSLVSEIVPKEPGMEWIAISYDWKVAVVLSHDVGKDDHVSVIDFNKASIVKTCEVPGDSFPQWLADVPGRGPTFEVGTARDTPGHDHVLGMVLDPLVPCEKSFATARPDDLSYIMASGFAGTATNSSDGTFGAFDGKGVLTRQLLGIDVTLGYEVPSDLRGSSPNFELIANNSQALLISVSVGGVNRGLVFRKADKTWHAIPQCCVARGFGRYVALTEGTAKGTGQQPDIRGGAVPAARAGAPVESAGRAEWRKEESRRGPNMVERFEEARGVYLGRLHIYDITTEKLYTITTNQGDSEILLIEDNVVYYRVNDRLYQASITSSGIGSATLMATDEAIRDAHWAFMKN